MSRIVFLPLAALALIAVASPHALAGDERMVGRIPVATPKKETDAKPSLSPARDDDRTAGGKKKSQPATAQKTSPDAAKPATAKTEAAKTEKPPVKDPESEREPESAPVVPAAASADSSAPQINTPRPHIGATMDRKALEKLGPLTNPLNGSLGHDMWDGTARSTLLKFLPRLPNGAAPRTAQLLARRVLLSNGDAGLLSNDVSPTPGEDLFTLRLEKLLDMGAYNDAVALYTMIEGEPAHDRLGRAGVMALMYGGFPAQACLEARAVHHDFASSRSAEFWNQIEAVCTFIQVQSLKAVTQASLQPASFKGFDRSAITGVPGSRILTTLASRPDYRHMVMAPKDIEDLSALERAVIKGLGRFDYTRLRLKQMQDISTPALMLMATDANVSDAVRASLNVEAARRGVIDSTQLGKLYLDLAGKEIGVEAATSPRLWDRYAAYARSTDEKERRSIVAAILESSGGIGEPTAMLPFAGAIPDIDPATLSARAALRNGLMLMLYSNIVPPEPWLNAWLKAESGDSVKTPDSVIFYLANLLPENLPTNSEAFPDEVLQPLFKGPEDPKSLEIWSVFSGLGRESALHNVASQNAYEKHVDLTVVNDYVMPTDGLLEQIRDASNNDRLGEVALLAAVALNEYSPGKTHPGVFREVLQSLATVGLKEEAQQVALGVVLSLEQ
ncbi:MAG: hypothetical protein HYU57_07405 [Micavibrio aeruginosavorus]|nr:hypothetical protein [Micavibrio aeruginosavorus]